MAGASITLDNADPVMAALAELSAALTDGTEIYDGIGAAMVARTKMRFDAGVGPDGNPWPPSIRAILEDGKTLVDKGILKNSMSHIPTPNSVTWGTHVIYAAVHQFGATITPKNGDFLHFLWPGVGLFTVKSVTIPARPFIGLSNDDRAEIDEIVTAAMARHLAGLN